MQIKKVIECWDTFCNFIFVNLLHCKNMKKILLFLYTMLLFTQCSTVPITGRKRINFVSDAQVLPTSFAQYKSFLAENKLATNSKKIAEVKAVGRKISKSVDRFMRANNMGKEAAAYEWEFNLIEEESLNAWCMPGGKVVFYTGILPIAKNTDGIAAIMGHEIAHAFGKHGQERMSSSQMQLLGSAVVNIGTQSKEEKERELWNLAYGVGSQLGMLKFSRTHETEADKLGMVFMILAGYNPDEAVNVWVRMQHASKGKTPEFLSTHPSNKRRIETLRNFIPEAKILANRYK